MSPRVESSVRVSASPKARRLGARVTPAACATLACAVGAAPAQVVTLAPHADATLFEDAQGLLANGAGDHVFAGTTEVGLRRRALLRFDLSGAIPPGATITGAELTLHMSRSASGSQPVFVHRALAPWAEGATHAFGEEGAGGPTEPGDTTWIHRVSPGELWATPGGDYTPLPSASLDVTGVGFYTWSGPDLVSDVALWAAHPTLNFGWLLAGEEAFTATAKRFDSRTNPDPIVHPVLRVEYIPAPGATALTLAAGMLVMPARRRRRSCDDAHAQHSARMIPASPARRGSP